MGELMRRYWIPAAFSSQIEKPDSPPIRVRLMGENLVLFRDTQGRVGLLERILPASHRLAFLRTQRGRRTALRLSRREVRRERRLRRCAMRAAGQQREGQDPRHVLSVRRDAATSCGPTWARPSTSPRFPISNGRSCRPLTASPRATSRNATGCRDWKAASTRAICRSCTAASWTCARAARTMTGASCRRSYEVLPTDFGFVGRGRARTGERQHLVARGRDADAVPQDHSLGAAWRARLGADR